LLNTDYKILTKLLAKRLQKVLFKIIASDQTGYIKNRYIGENIRTIIDIMQYTAKEQLPGILLQLDFEKAFDSVSWKFLNNTLSHFNFGPMFKKWVKIIYNQPMFCVTNNGYHSEFFQVSRGIRQGCPLSALLFVLVVEIMAANIRNNHNIKGIKVGEAEIKISQLADDTSLFLQDLQSVKHATDFLREFGEISGLKLNCSKTEAIWIGSNIGRSDKPLGIKWIEGTFKCLGVWCSNNTDEMITKNYRERINKIKQVLNIWQCRNLSLKGKVTVIWSVALPQLLYICSCLYTPQWVIKKLTKFFSLSCGVGKKHTLKSGLLFLPPLKEDLKWFTLQAW